MTGTLDDTLDRLIELERSLTRFEDQVTASWADVERSFDLIAHGWTDSARLLIENENEALRTSHRDLIQVEGPARLAFLRERQNLLQQYLRHSA